MKSFKNLLLQSAGRPLIADDVLEFHAARLLLLFRHCGIQNRVTKKYSVDGLTKMAKLDFFVRYPTFFKRVADQASSIRTQNVHKTESPMIRYQYGPWDERYYHVLAYLRSKNLIQIQKEGNAIQLILTNHGRSAAEEITKDVSYADLLAHMKDVARLFKQKSGNTLKNLIYKSFNAEVGKLPWGETIQP